jgi:hypothetical protein
MNSMAAIPNSTSVIDWAKQPIDEAITESGDTEKQIKSNREVGQANLTVPFDLPSFSMMAQPTAAATK